MVDELVKCIELEQFAIQLILRFVFTNLFKFHTAEGRYWYVYYEITTKINANMTISTPVNIEQITNLTVFYDLLYIIIFNIQLLKDKT
jgi:hypothetical protein